ncbi:MAG: signal peptide peptidase SppA, partial [Actinomycetes bacterium]
MDATKAITEAIDRFRKARTAPLILELDLTEGVVDGPPTDPLSAVMSMRRPRLTDILSGLKRARGDERVRALIVKIGGHPIEFGTVQELRAAIQAFRRSGGRTVAFAETFGEFGAGTVPYYLATACETICLQPSGDV